MNLISVSTDASDLGLVPLGDRLYKLAYEDDDELTEKNKYKFAFYRKVI